MEHYDANEQKRKMKAVIINSKGFGGNNATALILSPEQTKKMLQKKYGLAAMTDYQHKNEKVRTKSEEADLQTCYGNERITYQFGECVIDEKTISIDPTKIQAPAFKHDIYLPLRTPYWEYDE